MVELGLTLKQAREKKGYSLQEVAQLLKINARVLKAIEEGDSTQLPAPPFLRGFVKSYAHLVGVNVDLALKMMSDKNLTAENPTVVTSEASVSAVESEVRPPQTNPAVSTYSPPPLSQSPAVVKESNHRSFYMGALVILLGVLTIGFYQLIQKYEEERQLDERSAVSIEPAVQEVTAAVSETSEQPNSSAAENIATNDQNSPIPAPSNPSPAVTAVKPPATTPTNTTNQASTPATTTEAVANAEPTPQPAPQTPLSEIIVEAKNPVELTLTLASGKKQQRTLAPGQIYTLRTRGETTLSATDGGAIQLIINGVDRGTPGTTGQPLNMKVIE